MTPRVRRKRPALFKALAICTVVVAAMWLLSVWSTTRLGFSSAHVGLHLGMVRISTGDVARYEQQFDNDRWLNLGFIPFEWPASLGLHWPYWDGTITGFQIGMPLVAIWGPGALVVGVLVRRRPRPGYCYCGYDLTGNVSGRCPECGVAVSLARSCDAGRSRLACTDE